MLQARETGLIRTRSFRSAIKICTDRLRPWRPFFADWIATARGFWQSFIRSTATFPSVLIESSCRLPLAEVLRVTSVAASRHPVKARSFNTLARSLSISGSVACVRCILLNLYPTSSVAALSQASSFRCFHNRT